MGGCGYLVYKFSRACLQCLVFTKIVMNKHLDIIGLLNYGYGLLLHP